MAIITDRQVRCLRTLWKSAKALKARSYSSSARQALQLAVRQAYQSPEVPFPGVLSGDLVARPELPDPVADGAR